MYILRHELNARFLQPQIRDINKVIAYRGKIFKRYYDNLTSWLNDEFIICNKYSHKDKYNYHVFYYYFKKKMKEKNFFNI